ncbi:CLUMA_CG016608, isoform A [Clunio marinus]|uniref:CLUMA_CG016608, isoform A n=1 Tax=Clunio marinus TaxID=568069 RepID=A0A1J1IUB3_9DIPT|nr:CLUMA_CG016608, isoform A [Clunio marinus]
MRHQKLNQMIYESQHSITYLTSSTNQITQEEEEERNKGILCAEINSEGNDISKISHSRPQSTTAERKQKNPNQHQSCILQQRKKISFCLYPPQNHRQRYKITIISWTTSPSQWAREVK